MKSFPALRRGLAVALTLAVFAAVVAWSCSPKPASGPGPGPAPNGPGKDNPAPNVPVALYGGSVSRNMVNTLDKGIPDDWKFAFDDQGKLDPKESKNIKWVAELGSKAYGGPIVATGKVFVGTNNGKPRDEKITGDKGVVMCFDEATGKFLWQAVHDKLPAGQVWDWPDEGICSSAVVEGNRLWYISNRCEVVCADVNGDGQGKAKILWTYDMMKNLGVFPHNLATCSPLLAGDTLFLVTSNGVDEGHLNIPAPRAPSFIALTRDGKLKWQKNYPSAKLLTQPDSFKELANKGEILMHGQWSNPVYAEAGGQAMVIYPGGDGWLYALDPANGNIIWKFDCNPKDSFYELGGKGTRNDFIATPIVSDNKVYIGVGQDPEHKKSVGHLWCIDITKGKGGADVSPELADWSANPPKITPNPNSAKVWHFGGENDGKNPLIPKTRRYVFGRSMSTCAVHDGLVYTADLDGFVYCLDAKTGELYWLHDMKADSWCSPAWIDNKIYIGSDRGNLLIFEHGKKKNLKNTINMEDRVRTASVAANGVLYVMTENKLYAIK